MISTLFQQKRSLSHWDRVKNFDILHKTKKFTEFTKFLIHRVHQVQSTRLKVQIFVRVTGRRSKLRFSFSEVWRFPARRLNVRAAETRGTHLVWRRACWSGSPASWPMASEEGAVTRTVTDAGVQTRTWPVNPRCCCWRWRRPSTCWSCPNSTRPRRDSTPATSENEDDFILYVQ